MQGNLKTLEIVLKCDFVGSEEAILSSIPTAHTPGVEITVIHSGVGPVSKSDLLVAQTGDRLVVGFNVEPAPRIDQLSRELGVEIRLYDVIYSLSKDLIDICNHLLPKGDREIITGKAKVIEMFKSRRKGIILGCEVTEGALVVGNSFRVISAMGPIYTGRIESLQIERKPIEKARPGQQVEAIRRDLPDGKILPSALDSLKVGCIVIG